MSFTTPNGTRGVELPPAEQMRPMNDRMIANVRNGGSGMPGMSTLVLITVGKKTGQERETPVAYFAQPDGSYVVIASAAGAAKHPAWYFNLGAHPDQARIVVAGRELAVTAEELHGETRDALWQQITASSPGFAQYERSTDRTIPVIRLTPRR